MAGRAKLLVDFIKRSRPVKINGFTVPVQTRCISSSVFVSHSQRTHSCGELRASHVGQDVVLCGWLMHERALQFITLKDAHGVTQFIVPDNKRDTLCEVVKGLKFESVLQVKGKVIRRPEGQENPKMPTGDIEVEIEDLKVLNPSLAELPFKTRDYEEVSMVIPY
ncbi:aspartate--tRNA ligase, mitochondrial-like [Lingula anatina]|uniref:Aspartate--tRNA ligase, mitochondrial-like n=1 Tax=Lingula anatina TaxID=7574 RepID=A0A1S3J142_LINAN|nr:aspartate--tRNA ligase, mitochondrial-like [Lingula anatina]|eukprot:XP_013403976.1 aspartate--tRNA ligase, mitochondrial-like [Lingula anatina]